MVLGLAPLAHFPSNSDSHRVPNNIDLGGFGVSKDCLNKGSHLQNVFLGVVVLVGEVGISRSPCGSIELSFGVSLGSQISGQLPKASLPGDISVCGASPEPDITVSVDEDNRHFDNFLFAGVFSPKSSALKISSVKIPGRII